MKPFDAHSTANLQPLEILNKNQAFFEKPIYFPKKHPNFERFEKSYYLSQKSRQPRQILRSWHSWHPWYFWLLPFLAFLAFLKFLAFLCFLGFF